MEVAWLRGCGPGRVRSHMPAKPVAPPLAPFENLRELLSQPGLTSLLWTAEVPVLKDEKLAVLAARVGEGRGEFIEFLKQEVGIEGLGDRQTFANALMKALREGRITRGWAPPPPDVCARCGASAVADKKLLTCGRCKTARYCGAACQKAHWPAHKEGCKRPAAKLEGYANIPDAGEAVAQALPPAWSYNEEQAHAATVDAHKAGRVARAVDGGYHM